MTNRRARGKLNEFAPEGVSELERTENKRFRRKNFEKNRKKFLTSENESAKINSTLADRPAGRVPCKLNNVKANTKHQKGLKVLLTS